MKKIAIISTTYFPNIWNSHGRSTFSIAYGLAKLGYDVSVFTFTDKPTTYKQLEGQVTVYFIGGSWTVRPTKSLPFNDIELWNKKVFEVLSQASYDTIILNNWHGWLAASEYTLKNKAKIVSFIPFLYNFTGWLKPVGNVLEENIKQIEIDCITSSDVLVAHTKKFGDRLAAYCNREVYVIPNCYLELVAQSTAIKKIDNQVCFIGKVNREKCVERIIRVLPDLNDTTLVIASSEIDYYTVLLKLAKQLDVDHKIKFVSHASAIEVQNIYRLSVLAIIPSNFEPYGFPVLDALSCGTNILVSEWSCLEEYQLHANVFSSLKQLQEKITTPSTTVPMPSSEFSEPYITGLIETLL